MKAFFCELLLSCLIASPGAKPVDELTYGTLLYSYYQQDYQQALVQALVAERQGRRGEDPVRFVLAKGSFAFADGMYNYAARTFDSVAPAALGDMDRMRLSFHLAREYYRRQDWVQLGVQLERIDLGRTWRGRDRVHPEVQFMRSELAVHGGRYAEAEQALAPVDPEDPLRAYGLFNLGVALRASGDLGGARRVFQTLADTSVDARNFHDADRLAELVDLKQRARVALSFIAREQGAPTDAESVLGALPAASRYRDMAMASYGSLAMETANYDLAARIWLTLQKQDYWTSSTAQARLGFPLSLEHLASGDMALVQYRAAERGFENRLAVLTDLSGQADDRVWIRGLLQVFASPNPDAQRRSEIMERWQEQLGHTDWIEWLATEDTQQVLLEWRELLGMQHWLDGLPRTLSAFEEVAQERRRRTAEARTLLHDEKLLAARSTLDAEIERQADELGALSAATPEPSAGWMLKLADDSERKRLEELAGMRALIRRGMTPAEQGRWLARVARLEGVLFWRLVEERSARLRRLDKELAANRALLAEVDARIATVQTAESEFAAGVETDFFAFSDRASELRGKVDRALERREVALAHEIRRGIEREMREVQQYLLATRVAIARATDQLAMTTGDGE
jgi:hypothetical protein